MQSYLSWPVYQTSADGQAVEQKLDIVRYQQNQDGRRREIGNVDLRIKAGKRRSSCGLRQCRIGKVVERQWTNHEMKGRPERVRNWKYRNVIVDEKCIEGATQRALVQGGKKGQGRVMQTVVILVNTKRLKSPGTLSIRWIIKFLQGIS